MRPLAVAAIILIAAFPGMAKCNPGHPTPENPTIILGLLGGSILIWRYACDRAAQ